MRTVVMQFNILLRCILYFIICLNWRNPCYAALPGRDIQAIEQYDMARYWSSFIPDAEREVSPQEKKHTSESQVGCEGNELQVGETTADGRDETAHPTMHRYNQLLTQHICVNMHIYFI